MSTKDLGIQLHEELDRREKLLQQLTTECDALRKTLEIIERPTPEAHNRVTRVVGKKAGKVNKQGSGCEKHPSSDVNPKGKCQECIREYNRNWWANKKKNANQAPPANTPPVQVKCDSCGDRFPDAKSMGIHKTRVHFGDASLRRNAL